MGFEVDEGGGWLWELLRPVNDPGPKSERHQNDARGFDISIGSMILI